jgi:O-antigen/teichoic acid export membrane protein
MKSGTIVKKGIRLIFIDFFGLVIGILNGFFLPLVFSIDGYALFRTFTLYATYATVFSFGISDGIYLLYGGKDETSINAAKTKAYYFLLMKLQAVVFLILFFISNFLLKDEALIFFSFFVLPLQLIHFYRLYYKALGEFDKYSILQSVLVILELLNTLLIAFYLKTDEPHIFIIIKIINHIVIALFLTFFTLFHFKNVKSERLQRSEFLEIFKPGIIVLLADMVAAVIFSMDRWFVMLFFNEENFAYYSFAVSLVNLFLVFITSVASIFYSLIAKKMDDSTYMKKLKNCVLLVSAVFPLAYYFMDLIVLKYLAKYAASLDYLWIIMLTLPFIGLINVVYINLYKASKDIKQYLYRMLLIFLVTFLLNYITVKIFHTITAVAWTTLLSYSFWYLYSARDFKSLRITWNEVIFIVILLAGFSSMKLLGMDNIISFIIYLCLLIFDINVFYKDEIRFLLSFAYSRKR